MTAPPIPTTTPITVALVFDDMPEEDVVPSEFREAAPVAFVTVVEVEEETEVITLPETVKTFVTNTTFTEVDSASEDEEVSELCALVAEVVVLCRCWV
jgi:hypothetical protein